MPEQRLHINAVEQWHEARHRPETAPYHYRLAKIDRLSLTAGGDGGRDILVLDGTAVAAAGLDGSHDLVGRDIAVGDLAEHDVLAVEPAGHDGGDEELGAVAASGVR